MGLVCSAFNADWLGCLYLFFHLVRAVQALPARERIGLVDLHWNAVPADHAHKYSEIQDYVGSSVVVRLPDTLADRLRRLVRRRIKGYAGKSLADLFHLSGVRAVFPTAPCDFSGLPILGYIPDVQHRLFPHYYPRDQYEKFENFVERVGQRSTLIMVSSQASLDDIATFYPHLANKIRIIRPCSVPRDDWWKGDPIESVRQYNLPERFFLVSNQVCLHKNHRPIIRAVGLLQSRGLPVEVVCTGKADHAEVRDEHFFASLQEEMNRRGVTGRIRFLGAIPRGDHIALLRRAIAVVQPSEFEGWGFAISDAKMLGKQVIASDLPVHHEHNANRIEFVPTHDEEAWAAALARVWKDASAGPDLEAEKRALEINAQETLRVGRDMVALFRETMAGKAASW